MNKYIELKDVIKAVESADFFTLRQEEIVIKKLKSLPAIDIVICEECLWQDDCSRMVKSLDGLVSTALMWCSDGERKDDE